MGDESEGQPTVAPARQQAAQDLLADIFGGGGGATPSSAASPPPQQQKPSNDIMDLLGGSSEAAAPASTSPAPQPASVTAYDANGLRLDFSASKDPKQATVTNLTAYFTATEDSLSDINLQAAVPKVCLCPLLESPFAYIEALSYRPRSCR